MAAKSKEIDYQSFLKNKAMPDFEMGFEPLWMSPKAKPFQKASCEWSIRKGRAALLFDCGLGKTLMQLIYGKNIILKTNKPVLLLTPLAVSAQTIKEGEKFGIECKRTNKGEVHKGVINVTNYERLHYYSPKDFSGLICDESGILKGMDSQVKEEVTAFMKEVPYRLLCTATPAPNDYMELGNSSEALGVMSRVKMLGMFFANGGEDTQQWVLKPHARRRYWQWMSTWARACRMPSDLGFSDEGFILPKLITRQHVVSSGDPHDGFFHMEARTLDEQRAERKRTIKERCEKVAELVSKRQCSVVWCHLNQEGDLLTKMISGAVQVAGSNSIEEKEERLVAFSEGKIKVLVTKPRIGGFGLNWQHCSHMTFFVSNSFESYYQAVRRCWRFGQQNEVTVDLVTSERESRVMANMQRKEKQAAEMFQGIVAEMNSARKRTEAKQLLKEMVIPTWLR